MTVTDQPATTPTTGVEDLEVVPLRIPVPLAAVQGTLALDLSPRLEPPPLPASGRRPVAVVPEDAAPRMAVDQWSRRYVQAAVEIVGGVRPVSQLVRWTSAEVYADLGRRAALVSRAGRFRAPGAARHQPARPRVHSARTCPLGDGVVEAAVHVRYGGRSRAVAARFEATDGRWLCTALEFA